MGGVMAAGAVRGEVQFGGDVLGIMRMPGSSRLEAVCDECSCWMLLVPTILAIFGVAIPLDIHPTREDVEEL
jgi:hypothetical protein